MRRLTATIALLLHLLVSGALAFVHGDVQATPIGLGVHIEAEGEAACPPVHDHLACQLCRALNRHPLPAAPIAFIAPIAATGDISAPAFVSPARPGSARLAVDSRAPPIA